MSRRRYTKKFKTTIVLEVLKERITITEIAQKHGIHPQQITNWKREFLDNAESVFGKKKKNQKSEQEQKEDELHKIIGQQKVEIDFLKNALR
jgi:transposase